MPFFCRMSARYFAATSSFPGGFVVLMRINPCNHPSASGSICDRPELTDDADCDPGPYGGAGVDCPRTGAAAANMPPKIAHANTKRRAGKRQCAILDFPQSLEFRRRVTNKRYYHANEQRPGTHKAAVSG